MQFKVKFDFQAISSVDIQLPVGTIKAGKPFHLLDAYKEGDCVIIGVKHSLGIYEAGFNYTKIKAVNSQQDVKNFVGTFITPYIKGVEYFIYKNKK